MLTSRNCRNIVSIKITDVKYDVKITDNFQLNVFPRVHVSNNVKFYFNPPPPPPPAVCTLCGKPWSSLSTCLHYRGITVHKTTRPNGRQQILLRIREVSGWNLRDWLSWLGFFRGFPQFLQTNGRIVLFFKLGHGHFLPHFFLIC
jgi:hypothetical protein